MSRRNDKEANLSEHSIAKVTLFDKYLRIYLNIMLRAKGINKVYLFDLFAGEGEYANGEQGSSLKIFECVRDNFGRNNNSIINTEIYINDSGYSQLEPDKLKVERIKELADKYYSPPNVIINYWNEDYTKAIKKAIEIVLGLSKYERALVFIDPWGYGKIRVSNLNNLLSSRQTEVLLFLPTSFMYRFTSNIFDSKSTGSKALKKLYDELFTSNRPTTESQNKFIDSLVEAFRIKAEAEYVDCYRIERSKNNYFALFFFTNSDRGIEKLLEVKWKLDEEYGSGYRLFTVNQSGLFDPIDSIGYDRKLLKYIQDNTQVSNRDIYHFGLKNGFLPKHSNSVLKELEKRGKIVKESATKKPVRAFYLSDKKVRVLIKSVK